MIRTLSLLILIGTFFGAHLSRAETAIIAHRGLSGLAPESTRPAYEMAALLGADYLEADIQLTKDGVPVVFHDKSLLRTTNVQTIFPDRLSYEVKDFTWAELKMLDAGSWFNQKKPKHAHHAFEGAKILSAKDFLGIAERFDLGIFVEIKVTDDHASTETALAQLLVAEGWVTETGSRRRNGDVVVQSFSREVLRRYRQLLPSSHTLFLQSFNPVPPLRDLKDEVNSLGITILPFLDQMADPLVWSSLLEPWSSYYQQAGINIHVWTINQPAQMKTLSSVFNIGGIFTDRTDLAVQTLRGRSPKDVRDILDNYKRRETSFGLCSDLLTSF